ncbi:sugar ABC transporter permease [Clostridia bacterium]|nr:sugar ABC transporter permease [Clostridia bacterium]
MVTSPDAGRVKNLGHVKKRVYSVPYHVMMIPALILLIIFKVIPIIGTVMAFERYNPAAPWFGLASKWVGLQNFHTIFFRHPDAPQVIINTLIIAVSKILLNLVIPVLFALLLCECRITWLKRGIQTVVYLPHFLSWVIAGVMFRQIFSTTGLINTALINLKLVPEPIMFMASNVYFRPIVVLTDIIKGFGYSAVVYIAAITSIDVALYEAADIDGANRWQKMRFVTFPGILPTIVLMMTLALGNVLNAGSDQILNMYNPTVYRTGDILDTFVYRIGLQQLQFHLATAVGLVKSIISMLLIIVSYKLADRFAGYRIF